MIIKDDKIYKNIIEVISKTELGLKREDFSMHLLRLFMNYMHEKLKNNFKKKQNNIIFALLK